MRWRSRAPAKAALAGAASSCDAAEEAALVAAARADPRAFAPLYERYVGPVYRYCQVRLADREAAEDATSEVFVKALAALGDYRDGAFAAWLFRIAHNVVVDLQRRQRRNAPFEVAEQHPDPAPTPDEVALNHAADEELQLALAALSDEQRATVELQLLGWPDERIAGALDRSPAAVRMLRFRALARLRDLLPVAD